MLGRNIYKIRKQRGFSLTELAERAKISKSYLSNIERDINKNPSIEVIKRIAIVLDSDLKALINTDVLEENQKNPDKEWIELAKELQNSGIAKEQIPDYKMLLEFIKWQNLKESEGK
ncbi:helix-turn-helix domain-containing protein [Neobacillus sp. PS3-12]|uniref:helix-turn-helix domain-containing protein n=1 Tax=Neobacillus sp. PS3-12 TaxID=3070677 RepID=UPI0027E20DA1|nr:helix-turn-helix domain-containing protein [Neobacillus sp. PS3-12]WML51596.1 helix-turn-helix domain-containing protein [Neobacillus sp. PS3-12]